MNMDMKGTQPDSRIEIAVTVKGIESGVRMLVISPGKLLQSRRRKPHKRALKRILARPLLGGSFLSSC